MLWGRREAPRGGLCFRHVCFIVTLPLSRRGSHSLPGMLSYYIERKAAYSFQFGDVVWSLEGGSLEPGRTCVVLSSKALEAGGQPL